LDVHSNAVELGQMFATFEICRKVLMYSAQCWTISKEDEWRISTAETLLILCHLRRTSPWKCIWHSGISVKAIQFWIRPPGHPRSKWLDHIHTDNNLLPSDLWRCAIHQGHSWLTQRSRMTTRWQERRRPIMI